MPNRMKISRLAEELIDGASTITAFLCPENDPRTRGSIFIDAGVGFQRLVFVCFQTGWLVTLVIER
jgi:hypothetical protein